MATTLSIARAKASSPESMKKYFSLLEETLKKYGLGDDPALVFNMDETGFPLDPKPLKEIFVRGEKNPCSVTAGNKSQITVVGCVSAAGQCLPPMVVWPRKRMKPELAIGEVPGTVYDLVESGWMNQELFKLWFERHFLRYAPAARPLLLLLDGHSSHYCTETLKLAQEQDVIMFALPPNTTHLTQPLDKGAFGPLKLRWRQVVHDFRTSHPGQVVTQYSFCKLFSKAWVEAMTPMNISAGYKTTGIYPFNANALKLPCQKSDSCFIESPHAPPFTPAKRACFVAEEEMDDMDDSLVSSTQYDPCNRQSTMKMHNIENLPARDMKTTSAQTKKDPSGKIINSIESIREAQNRQNEKEAMLEAKKAKQVARIAKREAQQKAKEAKQQQRKKTPRKGEMLELSICMQIASIQLMHTVVIIIQVCTN